MKRKLLVLILLLVWPGMAFAVDTYLDDRSTPAGLIRSLYNAINLRQYGRAYDYFAAAPAKDFATYAKGFEGTAQVDVLVGQAGADGAAGSTYFNMPTAIRSTADDGTVSYYAGCYTIRSINADQDPPYRPLQIHSHKLKPIKADDYASGSLPKCSDIAAPDTVLPTNKAALIAKAKAQFVVDAAAQCDKTADTQGGLNEPETHTITYKLKDEDATTAPHTTTLFKFVCHMAAYNETEIFYLTDEVDGIKRLAFAEPQFIYTYSDTESTKLKSMKLTGFSASGELINADYDPKTGKISSIAKWRGIGDAASYGLWEFKEGQFVLQNYDIDPTYDEKINPISVVKNGQFILKP